MRLTAILALLLCTNCIYAQRVNQVVLDYATQLPVADATVLSKKAITFTSATGSFSIIATKYDTITITHVGYKPYKLVANIGLMPTIIYMQPDNILLDEVAIRGTRNYTKDSLINRRQFTKVFNYKAPTVKDVFMKVSPNVGTGRSNNTSELVSVDVLKVFSLINKKNDPTYKLQKAMLRDEEDSYVYRRFSKEKITQVTGLKGDSLSDFIIKYRPPAYRVRQMGEYDMIQYIKKSYADYRKPAANIQKG